MCVYRPMGGQAIGQQWAAGCARRRQRDSPIHFRAKFVGATHISMSMLIGFDSGKLIVGDG